MLYSVFGLTLGADRPIPGLIPQAAVARTATRIWLDAVSVPPEVRTLHEDVWYVGGQGEGGSPGLRVWRLAGGVYFRLQYGDGTEFLVDGAGARIWASWLEPLTLEDTATYLLGPVLGFVLRLRGITCLHASAVAVGGRAIVLLGPAEAGKSTTAAALCRMGYPVLTDDVAALVDRDGTIHVEPAYPQLRLWPDSVAMLYGAADALPRLTPNWDKRALDLTHNGYRFQHQPLPLAAIYLLAERSTDAEVRVEGLQGRERLLALLANTYVSYLLDSAMRAQELAVLGRLASGVPVRRVVPPAQPNGLTPLCTRILEDVQALLRPSTADRRP